MDPKALNIEPLLIPINLLGFVALLYAAWKMVFVPITKVIDARDLEIASGYDKLDRAQREMEALKADYETRLAAIEAEARETIQTAIKEAQSSRDQIVGDANVRSREIVTRAEAEANREKEQAMIELRQQIVDLALGAATKVIGEGLDATKQKALIDDFIKTGVAPAASPTVSGTAAEA